MYHQNEPNRIHVAKLYCISVLLPNLLYLLSAKVKKKELVEEQVT